MKGLPAEQASSAIRTFVFTDIEGSTRLWEREPERMHDALAQHDMIARTVVREHRGEVVKTTGDGVHAVFDDPFDALRAAVALLLALANPAATGGIELRVRCGLHAGTESKRTHDFYGTAVNRAARVMSVAYGGQILLSSAVASLVSGRLPEGVALRELGAVRLRNLAEPEVVSQVVHARLRQEFPALRSLAATPNNLPHALTSFIGREHELSEARRQLSLTRLLTLVGIGGIGKSRLSLQLASDVLDEYIDGVWFVELAPVTDPRVVPHTIAAVLGVKEDAGRTLGDALRRFVADRRLLLVLDNCEHLAQACAELARELLEAGPNLRILASSRERLNIRGERTYPLAPLAVPVPRQNMAPDGLETFAAARLFVERARAVRPDFAVTRENAATVADICMRLDGIPLALELAAARMGALSVEAISARLTDRFRLLRGGDRTALPRQQTLRALIDWSYDLLDEPERALFRRLAIFAGSFTLEAVEAVAAGDGVAREDMVDLVTELVEKSLIALDAGGDRYRMLETVRQYAEETLRATNDGEATRTRHLQFYAALAESARPKLTGPDQGIWLARLDRELENMLAAHRGCDEATGKAAFGLQLITSLKPYWIIRGHFGLGLRLTLEALARYPAQPSDVAHFRALLQAGQLGLYLGRYDEAAAHLHNGVAIARGLGDRAAVQAVLPPLATTAIRQGDLSRARMYLNESVTLARNLGNRRQLAAALSELAQLDRLEGNLTSSREAYVEVLELARALNDRESIAVSLVNLAMVAISADNTDLARGMLREVAVIARETGSKPTTQALLDAVVALDAISSNWQRAARLRGAAEALAEETGLHRHPADEAFVVPFFTMIRTSLGEAALQEEDVRGRAMSLASAMDEARACLDGEEAPASPEGQ